MKFKLHELKDDDSREMVFEKIETKFSEKGLDTNLRNSSVAYDSKKVMDFLNSSDHEFLSGIAQDVLKKNGSEE